MTDTNYVFGKVRRPEYCGILVVSRALMLPGEGSGFIGKNYCGTASTSSPLPDVIEEAQRSLHFKPVKN